MPVNFLHMPARGFEAHDLICAIRQLNRPVDRDVVVVPKHNQFAKLVTACKTNRFLGHTFHQAAVARDHICVVIDDFLAVARALDFFCHRETNGIGDALAQGTGRCFNRICEEILRMARCERTFLAEVLYLVQSDLSIAHKIEQGVKQHGAVTRRENKAIAISPKRRTCVKLHVLLKEHGRNIGHAHRHTRVARIGGVDCVQSQRTNGGCLVPVIRVGGAKSCNIQKGRPL